MTETVRRISAHDLKRRLDAGEILVFDVRKREIFDQGHVKGAGSLPIKELATWVREVPHDKSIVLY